MTKESLSKTASNPFELKFNKRKFDILNKSKQSAVVGKPGASRKNAENARKKSLLREYKSLGKTSKLLDKRFGRGIEDEDEGGSEVALTRFALARSKKERTRAKYQLSDDDDEDDHDLTHKGQGLSSKNMNDFIDNDDALANEEMLDRFGNFGEQPKSKAEIMQELISKSKFYKYERQRVKEENESLCGDVDANFDLVRKGLLREENRRFGRDNQPDTNNIEDFDSTVRKLAFEKRMIAQNDSKKTVEELERMQLEKDFKRQQEIHKRMLGNGDEEGEECEGDVQLSKKMIAVEAELARIVKSLCQSSNVEEIEALYSQIIEGLSASSHRQILLARVCRGRLSKIFKGFTKKALHGQAVLSKSRPIMLLHLIGHIFSTLDFHHIVTTPAHLCGVYLLDYSRITKARHVVYSLWICEILLDYQSASKRYIPEVMNALFSLLLSITGKPCPEDCCYLVKTIKCKFNGGTLEYSVSNLLANPDMISKDSIISKLESIVMQASDLYDYLEAFPELFNPFIALLNNNELACKLSTKVEQFTAQRGPLLLQDHKPIPLPQLEPFIEDDIAANRYKKFKRPDNPQREAQQLRTTYRKELRNAQKELRKDANFLAREQLAVRKSKDAEYQSRIKKLYGTLANEGSSNPK